MDQCDLFTPAVSRKNETQKILQLYFLNLNAQPNELSLMNYAYHMKVHDISFHLICITYQTKFISYEILISLALSTNFETHRRYILMKLGVFMELLILIIKFYSLLTCHGNLTAFMKASRPFKSNF